jgi:hypothetical protein
MQISAALGLAVLGSLATDHTGALVAQGSEPRSALTAGYQLAYAIAAACVAVGLVGAQLLLPRSPGARTASSAPIEAFEPGGADDWRSREAA